MFLNRNHANSEVSIDNETLSKVRNYVYIEKMVSQTIDSIPCILPWPAMANALGMNMLYVNLSNLFNVFNLFNHLILILFLCVCFTAHRIEICTETYVTFKGCPNMRWLILQKPMKVLIYDEFYTQVCVFIHLKYRN